MIKHNGYINVSVYKLDILNADKEHETQRNNIFMWSLRAHQCMYHYLLPPGTGPIILHFIHGCVSPRALKSDTEEN